MSEDALTRRNDGTGNIPGVDSEWDAWVSATRTRNWMHEDPLLDWLELHGEDKGYPRDEPDPRTDFGKFVMAKGIRFEEVVTQYLGERHQLRRVAADYKAVRTEAGVRATWEAMAAGPEILTQAPIWNPENETYGIIDLLVRSDVLGTIFPGSLDPDEAARPAPDLPGAKWHYRVVDIKFTTLELLKDGHAASGHLSYAVQVWIYNEALGRLQGYTPPSGYLLGRGWKKTKERGGSALERLSRVDHHYVPRNKDPLSVMAQKGIEWIRRVRSEGQDWDVVPMPTVSVLYPNMKNQEDAPWSGAKKKIAQDLKELTLLPRVSPAVRRDAHRAGLLKWDDPTCSADRLGITTPAYSRLVTAVIEANHSPRDGPVVFPARLRANEENWREPGEVEFYVDFETVSDLDDSFDSFPDRGGQPLIFMVGCGHRTRTGEWSFKVFSAGRLTEPEEARILKDWIGHMRQVCQGVGVDLAGARIFHWSPAERVNLETAYNSAAARHGLPRWADLGWVDLLRDVVKAEPIGVRGAFGYGLKAVTKAMHQAGLVPTDWTDGPADGLGAMVGAWWCDAEAARRDGAMRDLELYREIEAYNRVDVEAMRDVLGWLRGNR